MKRIKEKIFDELMVMQFQSGQKSALTILVRRWQKKCFFILNGSPKIKKLQKILFKIAG